MSIQPGAGYNFVTSGGATAMTIDPVWQYWGEDDQFQVTAAKAADGYQVQCRKGYVLWNSYFASIPWSHNGRKAEVQKFYCFPTGSKTDGEAATADDSPFVDLGGYITIQPASVEGGSDSWGVYIIACAGVEEYVRPYLAIFADGSDADTKSDYFNGSNDQVIFKHIQTQDLVEVSTPSGSTYLTIQAVGALAVISYNCIRYKVASLTYEDGTFKVTQKFLGPMKVPYPVNYQGLYTANDPAPSPPAYDTELTDWFGAWSGYTKDSTGATVEV
jgi:hypothetical protein